MQGTDSRGGESLEALSRAELKRRVRRRTTALENVMDTMVDVLVQIGPDGRVQRANRALYEKLGYEEGDVVGRPVDYVFAAPEDNEQLSDMMTEGELLDRLLSQGHVTDLEVWFARADGERVPMSLSASVMDGEDGVAGIVCVAKDISERVTAQRRAEFLHSLLRHDLGNKLQVIGMNLQLVTRESETLPEGVRERLSQARGGIEDATELIEDVRRLHRLDGVEAEPVRLERVVADAVERTADLAAHRDVGVENHVDGGRVLGGPMLRELVTNLVENALVHSGGTRVRLRSRRETVGDDERVVLSVADDGQGVPDEQKERIAEKGYSGDARGSGLGLYLVERIAASYGATVEVGDAALGGARFEVGLVPADAESGGDDQTASASGDDGDGDGRALDE
jgi:PAS domain S-box-containing protein